MLSDIAQAVLPSPVSLTFSIVKKDEDSTMYGWKVAGITNASMKDTKLTKSMMDAIHGTEGKVKDLASLLVC